MSKKIRMKFIKTKDMIYISHLDVQRLLQRVFRRADIELSFSQGFNPHPKITYGNALALGVESYGEYVDIEIEADLAIEVLKERLNAQLPDGMAFVKLVELVGGERNLASSIEYGDYEFTVENVDKISREDICKRLDNLMAMESIMMTKKNKKGKMVDIDIKPLINTLSLLDYGQEEFVVSAILATGSKQNLNTNIFIPKLLEVLGISIDPLDVDIKRNDLYFRQDGQLVSPL
ncbi:TIGR03936 family radical SAM-associated protein [Peptostreptococcus stomatis]|uniref:TIGR03936 family radical SAM-associated protein n=1 Tax=Peptostreptococcus stomatis TaxID=341694 RepID=UPI003F9F57CB